MTDSHPSHHGYSYTRLFSLREMVRDLRVQCVREVWVRQVDLDSLEMPYQDLIEPVPGGLGAYRPRLRYILKKRSGASIIDLASRSRGVRSQGFQP